MLAFGRLPANRVPATQGGTVSGGERAAADRHASGKRSAARGRPQAPSSSPPYGLASESGPLGPRLPIPLAQPAQRRLPPPQLVQHHLGGLRHGGRGRKIPIGVKTVLNERDGD